ncbi:MAG TPA: hypothetical protein VKD91_16805 [Pyrinomonadaceae bacterium]|nr:hypothetical protein [Pyrinomonadaceae bacterium]
MKRCPTRTRVYDGDHLRFCLDDGSPLINKTLPAYIPPTIAATRQSRHSLLVWIIVMALAAPFPGACTMLRRKPLSWHLVVQVNSKAPDRAAVIQQTVTVIERRLEAVGVRNYEVRPQDAGTNDRILISLPSVESPDRLKQLITAQGKLELVHVISPPSPAPVQTYNTREEARAASNSSAINSGNRRVLPYSERADSFGKWVVVESPPIINGSELRNASAVPSANDNTNYEIVFSLTRDGADKFGAWTGANVNEYLGVVLNDEVKSIAFVRGQIFDQGEITGRFTRQSADDLALVLKTGALPAPVQLVEERVDK